MLLLLTQVDNFRPSLFSREFCEMPQGRRALMGEGEGMSGAESDPSEQLQVFVYI